MLANLIRCFQPQQVGRRLTGLASSAMILAALVALTFSAASLARPQTVSAQAFCNGSYDPFNMGCSSTNSNFCNGSFNPFGTGCATNAFNNCNGVSFSYGANCSTSLSNNCNGLNYSTAVNCSANTSYSCNGIGYSYAVNCSTNAYNNCGVNYSYSVGCAITASSYSCNGIGYSTPVNCLSATNTTCTNGMVAYSGQLCPTTYTACANGGQVLTGQQCPSSIIVVASSPQLAANTSYSAPQGFSVTYAAGWNIVAGPTGSTLTGITGSIYTFRPGDTAYEAMVSGSPLAGGTGWWAYFNANTTTTIMLAGPGSSSQQLPAGQFVMIGNSGNTTATVSGADTVLVYNPTTGSYNPTMQLAAGQGAWAMSWNGGLATLTNSPT